MREKLNYMVGVYNNGVFVSNYMTFEDQEKRPKEYPSVNNNFHNIVDYRH